MRAYPKSNSECSREEYARRKARWLLKDAVRYGKIKRGPCEMRHLLECEGPIEGHHDDYSKPYDVRWLCRKHHRKIDAIPRTRSEAVVLRGNQTAIDMHRPNPRYDRPESTA